MQSRSREGAVTPRRRGLATCIRYKILFKKKLSPLQISIWKKELFYLISNHHQTIDFFRIISKIRNIRKLKTDYLHVIVVFQIHGNYYNNNR